MNKTWSTVLAAALPSLIAGIFGLVANTKQDQIYELRFKLARAEMVAENLAGRIAQNAVAEQPAPTAQRSARHGSSHLQPTPKPSAPKATLTGETIKALAEATAEVQAITPSSPRQTQLKRAFAPKMKVGR